jgi:hypothetical protein
VNPELLYFTILNEESGGVQTGKKATLVLTQNGQEEISEPHHFEEAKSAKRVVHSRTNKLRSNFPSH